MYNEKRKINKLRRRNSLLIIIILSLGLWIKNLYDDKSWLRDENSQYFYSNLEKDKQIKNLYTKIDSLKKLDLKPEEVEKPKAFKKKVNKDTTSTKDTLIFIKYPSESELKIEEKKDSLK